MFLWQAEDRGSRTADHYKFDFLIIKKHIRTHTFSNRKRLCRVRYIIPVFSFFRRDCHLIVQGPERTFRSWTEIDTLFRKY